MRSLVKAFVLIVVLTVFFQSSVLAGDRDYITESVQALQESPVYVAPGTQGTDNDTAGRLRNRLNQDDNIFLVMLPAEAETALGQDVQTIATNLSEALGNQRIIGLAVGENVVGYAPTLPSGVAADQMRRANSVSNDPVTALGTFASNMHVWQAANPEQNPAPPETAEEETSSSAGVWVVVALAISAAIVLILIFAFLGVTNSSSPKERTNFKAPDQVKDLLAKISRLRVRVHDKELQKVVYQMCLDIEKYFDSSSKDKKRDSSIFKSRLTEVFDVMKKYVDIQENPRYYHEPRTELGRGKVALIDFANYVLESIRNGFAADLLDYKVNTRILQATRHR